MLKFAGFAQETEMNKKPCKLSVCPHTACCRARSQAVQCNAKLSNVHRCCAHGMPWQVMTKQHCLLQCCKLSHFGQVGQKYCQKSERFFLGLFFEEGMKIKICWKINPWKWSQVYHLDTQHLKSHGFNWTMPFFPSHFYSIFYYLLVFILSDFHPTVIRILWSND